MVINMCYEARLSVEILVVGFVLAEEVLGGVGRSVETGCVRAGGEGGWFLVVGGGC